MSTRQSYSTVKTKLISSYAWDTAIDFIQKTNSDNEHSDYATIQSYAAAFYPYINCGGNFGNPSNHFPAGHNQKNLHKILIFAHNSNIRKIRDFLIKTILTK